MNYYMIITTKEDYNLDVKNNFICAGFPERNKNSVSQMNIGDKLVFYVTKLSRFCSIVEVTGKSFKSKEQIWTDDFDLWQQRIPTQPIIKIQNARNGVYIKDIWDNLEFIKNKIKWGTQVQGSFRKLTEHDYNVIKEALKENNK